MLPKVHLTSEFRISGSKWVTTPSWLSGSLRPFLSSSSVYSCHLFSIYSVSLRSLLFLSFILPILAWNVSLMSVFWEWSPVLPTLSFSSASLRCSFKKAFLSRLVQLNETLHSVGYIFPFLCCLLLLFFPQLCVKLPQTTPFLLTFLFSLEWFWSLTLQCYEPLEYRNRYY